MRGVAGRRLAVVERSHPAGRVTVDDEPAAADVAGLGEHHREGETDGHRGVDCVAAASEDVPTHLARERMGRHDHRVGSGDRSHFV